MLTRIINGILVSDSQCKYGDLVFRDGKITTAAAADEKADCIIDAKNCYVCPGFIDIHTHGAGGYDYLDNTPEAFLGAAKMQASGGATTVVPTVTSSDTESMRKAIKTFEKVKKEYDTIINMPGLHFEGPYFALSQRGAQDEKYVRPFNEKEYKGILDGTDSVIRWSAAPELEGAEKFAAYMKEKNILASIGHSDAECTCALKAFGDGFSHITHLYSGMSSVHRKNGYRYAGIVEAAYLDDDVSVEIIADGAHLPPELLKLIVKIKGPAKVALITDSMRAAGMPKGKSILGGLKNGLEVLVEDGVAKLLDRSAFAGSVALCNRLVRNMVQSAGVSMADAVRMVTQTPAEIMNFSSKGSLRHGYDADITILDKNFNVVTVVVSGKQVYSNADLC